MRRLYADFVTRGDLVLDVGAHAGNRTRAFLALGCRLVAIHPHPDFAQLVLAMFDRSTGSAVVEAAVTEAPGRAVLSLSERTPTVTTLAETWRQARAGDPDFSRVAWNRRIDVETTTLDALVGRYGVPAFVKIDVEGGEPAVLAGLTQAVPALSFEYLPRALDHVEASIARVRALGPYRFNWSLGESYRLASSRWMNDRELLADLRTPVAQRRPGDVYARIAEPL